MLCCVVCGERSEKGCYLGTHGIEEYPHVLCTLVHVWLLELVFRFPLQKSDTVMLSIVNSLAVIYIYNQFSSLRKAGSKYLLGQQLPLVS